MLKQKRITFISTLALSLFFSNAYAQTEPTTPEKVVEEVKEEVKEAVPTTLPAKVEEKVETPLVVVPPKVVVEEKIEVKEEKKEVELSPKLEPEIVEEETILWKQSGEVRLRGNFKVLGNKAQSLESRARLGIFGKYKKLSLNIQVQDARTFGFAGVGDGAMTGIHQGYFQLDGEDMWFRAGRQEIAYGGQRMIGSLNWTQMARSFDAMRFHTKFDALQVDLFGAVTAPQNGGTDTIDGNYLSGLYITYGLMENMTIEPYVLFRHNGPHEVDVERNHNIVHFGLRSAGKLPMGVKFDVEGGLQVGARNGNDHLAYAGAALVGYTIDNPMKPTIGAGFTYASGQSKDGKVSEFDNFYPTNHKFYGSADLFGWRNIMQGEFSLSASPMKGIKAKLAVAPTLVADKDARWSSAGGKTIGAPSSDEAFLGTEIDFNAGWKPMKYFSFGGGYSIFLPAAGGKERLGSDDPIHTLYLVGGVNFK